MSFYIMFLNTLRLKLSVNNFHLMNEITSLKSSFIKTIFIVFLNKARYKEYVKS